jgi:hydroxyacid-oxoacid transhydrogenase
MAVSRELVKLLLKSLSEGSCRCPAHSQGYGTLHRHNKEYAFEMTTSTIRYGAGVTREVGMDIINMNGKNVALFTDRNVIELPVMDKVLESLHANGVSYTLYDGVEIEPTDESFNDAISFAKGGGFDVFLAVGGGSVMDTAKAANLYYCHPECNLLDFVNQPIGKGLPVTRPLKPLICVPTTAGTGSETTGVAIFDYKPLNAKTGIGNRAIRPTIGLVDPLNVMTMPQNVTAFSGFDVLWYVI